MFGISVTRLVVYGIITAAVIGVLFMLRHELIEKGKNLVYAEDNAALVKAQQKQTADDAERLKAQGVYIEHLESQGTQIKEKIRYVQAPCIGDGAADPRLGDVVDWLRGRPAPGAVSPLGGQPSKGDVPPPHLPAAKR